VGGAAIGGAIKGEYPINCMAGAGIGTIAGGIGGEIIKGTASKFGKDTVSDVTGAIFGGYINEQMGNIVKDTLDEKDKTNAKK